MVKESHVFRSVENAFNDFLRELRFHDRFETFWPQQTEKLLFKIHIINYLEALTRFIEQKTGQIFMFD